MKMTKRFMTAALVALTMLLPALASGAAAGPGPAYFASENVQWISGNPIHTGSSGARLYGGYFYVTDPRGVYIYDVANPASPVLTGFVNVFQSGTGAVLGQEDPDTNGKILIVDATDPKAPSTAKLLVIDVSNKTAPSVIGSVATTDHTWTCVADCTYAYGRTGGIIDLTTPSAPKIAANWKSSVPGSGYTHDFTEIRPGRVMSVGQPSFYLDSTVPTQPQKLTRVNTTFSSLGYHSAVWPRAGQDKFMVMGTEIAPAGTTNAAGSDCQGDGEIATYNTDAVLAAEQEEIENPDGIWGPANFTKVDFWEISGRGTYTDGRAPFHTLYCSHWFDTHPDWNNGGLIAMAHYDFGTRFLKVDQAGEISEVGWFQPVGGYTASAYWITDDIVYTLDYRRGLDILRMVDNPAASGLIKVPNPGTRTTHGISEEGCKTLGDPYGPTNGTDGIILPIPEDKRDGTHKIRVVGSSVGPYDLDVWFHDEGCVSMSGTGLASDSPNEQGSIPEGAAFASVDLYTGPPTYVMVTIDP